MTSPGKRLYLQNMTNVQHNPSATGFLIFRGFVGWNEEEIIMCHHAIKFALAGAVCAWFVALAPFSAARAGESALDACRKWTGQGAGEQYKCFDCMRQEGAWPNERWVNTCADESRGHRADQSWHFLGD